MQKSHGVLKKPVCGHAKIHKNCQNILLCLSSGAKIGGIFWTSSGHTRLWLVTCNPHLCVCAGLDICQTVILTLTLYRLVFSYWIFGFGGGRSASVVKDVCLRRSNAPHSFKLFFLFSCSFIRNEYRRRGFDEVITPNVYHCKLWDPRHSLLNFFW